jgi:ABC-type transport system involved in cytochrome bd biosynthesis fused ATPase/permease subunit
MPSHHIILHYITSSPACLPFFPILTFTFSLPPIFFQYLLLDPNYVFTIGVGGVIYAIYAEWRVALVVLSCCPIIAFFAMNVVKLNQTKSERSAQAYSKAGSIAYSTVSGIKTVLSLNACTKIIKEYKIATQNAFLIATRTLIKQGFVNGMMLGTFTFFYLYFTFNLLFSCVFALF